MNLIHILTGTRFTILCGLLRRNGFTLDPGNLLTLAVLFQNALLSSVLARVERKKYSSAIRDTPISKPPVFIVGHWRTGSTFLHQLLHTDPQMTSPTLVQTVIPDHFLFSTRYYVPIMKRLMPKTRPMDEIALSPLDPQEDEFALIRLGSESPLERLFFPKGDRYFLNGYNGQLHAGRELEIWKENQLLFYRKITLLTGKQIVSKNPLHTMRMDLLAEIFPGARFIHITRHPYEVVPSTIRMWNIVAEGYSLRKGWRGPEVAEVAEVYRAFLSQVLRTRENCSPGLFTEVRFEDLEKDPVSGVKRIYAELDLEFSQEFEQAMTGHIRANRDYRKNTHEVSDREKKVIREQIGNELFLRYGWE